jgi:3',5'-cyclic AMP phosphodiesterase CpdA
VRVLSVGVLGLALIAAAPQRSTSPFVAAPYLQIGTFVGRSTLTVVWHAPLSAPAWSVDWRPAGETHWRPAGALDRHEFVDRAVWSATLPVGSDGGRFRYRVAAAGAQPFEAEASGPAPPGRSWRLAMTGDAADNGPAQRALARQIAAAHEAAPLSMLILTGDLVYDCGLRAEYSRSFFPVYNADPGSASGVPLMRDVPFVGAIGNHDVGDKGWLFNRCSPDYAYFAFWRHPAGPAFPVPITPRHAPRRPQASSAVPESALPRALSAATFSYTWGDAHITVLDSNKYVDWAHPDLLGWLEADLAEASSARWRLVAMHHPPIHFSDVHRDQQWMRALMPIFERHRVTIVAAGHVHNFQWIGPVAFEPDADALVRLAGGERGRLPGRATFLPDASAAALREGPPVYVVTGAGGHNLKAQAKRCPDNLQPAPVSCAAGPAVEGGEASVSLVDIGPETLVFRQVTAGGRVLLTRTFR